MGGADSEVTKGIVGEEERPVMTGRSYSTILIAEGSQVMSETGERSMRRSGEITRATDDVID